MRFTRLERFTAGALVYLALGSLWIYGVLDRGLLEDRGALGWLVVALVAVGHVAFGYVMREWAALLLPIALVLLAIPAGYPESRYSEPAPLWYGQAFHALFEVVLIAFGLGLRSSAAARRGTTARSSCSKRA
jgi:hypothetical protein